MTFEFINSRVYENVVLISKKFQLALLSRSPVYSCRVSKNSSDIFISNWLILTQLQILLVHLEITKTALWYYIIHLIYTTKAKKILIISTNIGVILSPGIYSYNLDHHFAIISNIWTTWSKRNWFLHNIWFPVYVNVSIFFPLCK